MASSVDYGVSRLLAGVDVHPASLPDAAVLLVRRLADPAPGALRIGGPAACPPAVWERALQTAVNRAARDAARPALGPVPAAASAVVFLDPSELLACLARDLLQGDVAGNWWWQAWLRATGRSTIELVLEAWLREARHIPAAIAHLNERGLASGFIEALSPRQARTLFVAMTDAYDVPALAAPTPPVDARMVTPHGSPRPPGRGGGEPAVHESERLHPSSNAQPRPPWAPLVPDSQVAPGLGLEQRTLLGIALAISRAPLATRTRAFQRALHAWRCAEQFRLVAAAQPTRAERRTSAVAQVPDLSKEAAVTPVEAADANRPSDVAPTLRAPFEPAGRVEQRPPGEPPSQPAQPGAEPMQVATREDARAITEAELPADAVHTSTTAPRPSAPSIVEGSVAPESRPMIPGLPPPALAPEPGAAPVEPRVQDTRAIAAIRLEAVTTDLGGVLFLINALQQLGFFDRLDDHFGIISSIGGWGWLEILARCLLGDRRSDLAIDPIWNALATLDGRRPGNGFTFHGPRVRGLPGAWPVPVAAESRPPRKRRSRPLGLQPAPPLQRFLDTIVPYLRWRLVRAMALDARPDEDGDALLASRLLSRRGRLTCTATHVDLHMSMDQIDIAVRLAGLDANPGWVPALGRVVTFFFERE